MHDESASKRAKELGVKIVPSIIIDGKLASCCSTGGYNKSVLLEAGLGVAP